MAADQSHNAKLVDSWTASVAPERIDHNANFVHSWAAPLIPEQIDQAVQELKRLGYTGLADATRLMKASQEVYADTERIRADKHLSLAGKDAKIAALKETRNSLRAEVAAYRELLQAQTEAKATALAVTYPEPSETVQAISFRTLEKQGITPITIGALWDSGDEYRGFVARHLVTYARLINADHLGGIEREVDRLTGNAERSNCVAGLIASLNALLAYNP